jgi:periplasmic protein TonB
MRPDPGARGDTGNDVYTPREIAVAAGVPVAQVLAALNGVDGYVPHADAVRLGRLLVRARSPLRTPRELASPAFTATTRGPRSRSVGFVASTAVHVAVAAIAFLLLTRRAPAPIGPVFHLDPRADAMRLVFLVTPGPGGGGGGGGLRQKTAPPRSMREGRAAISSPLPKREPPKPIEAAPPRPEPKPPVLDAEKLPAVVAPIVAAPADIRNRPGILEKTTVQNDSHGSGIGGGTGTGSGTGIGGGDGAGIGPGSGGGTGGGPYRPGSGIEAPRLVREIKADYTEDARRRGLEGEVVLEIVVRSDGSVGDVKLLQGLGAGLNERAIQAVRQWRFAPARRLGAPVDVVVEVSVEFRLR